MYGGELRPTPFLWQAVSARQRPENQKENEAEFEKERRVYLPPQVPLPLQCALHLRQLFWCQCQQQTVLFKCRLSTLHTPHNLTGGAVPHLVVSFRLSPPFSVTPT